MMRFCCFTQTSGIFQPRQTQDNQGFIFFLFYYTNIVTEIYQKLKLEIRSKRRPGLRDEGIQ
jgi:hypothetical protein